MPAAIATALVGVGMALESAFGAFLIANATTIATVGLVLGSVAVGDHQRRKAKQAARDAYNASLQDRLVMVPSYMGARSRCYGRVRNVDGVLFKGTRGTNKEIYTLFIAVAGHEIDAFEQVYFGDTLVTLDGNGYVQTAPYALPVKTSKSQTITLNGSGGGSVTATGTPVAGSANAVEDNPGIDNDIPLTVSVAGSVITVSGGGAGGSATVSWQETTSPSKARVRFYTGAAGQDVSTVLQPLFPSLITTGQHRFAGIAGMLVDLEYDTDAYPAGVPSISAVFRGAKIYDPRTGLTAWSENPALIARDWALYARGGACVAADLAAASFTAAANACDTVQAYTTPSGTTNLPLYTCGIVASLEADPWQTFQEMVESMAGKTGWAGGLLRVVAGVYRAPVATITEDWISDAGAVRIVPEPPTDEAVNIYRPTLADKAQAYTVVQAPEVRAATYITADGRELPREVTLGGVTDTTHAQHVCGVLMRDARNALSVVLPCNLRAFQLELYDVVSVTLPRFGWSAKTFEVVGWQFALAGGIELVLKETAAAIYQPDSLFAVVDVTPNTALPNPALAPAMGALTVTGGTTVLTDGTSVTRVRVQWPAPADQSVSGSGEVELQYWPATQALPAGDWVQAPPIPGNALETTLAGVKAGTVYLFRARFVTALGVRGAWGVHASYLTPAAVGPTWASIDGKPADSELLNLQGSYAVAIAWNFTGTAEGWTAAGASLSVAGASITVTSSGTDPQLVGPVMSVPGVVFNRVRARIKRTAGAGWDGTAFYSTASHTWETAYRKTVTPDPTVLGEWRTVEWDMASLTAGGVDWLSNTITGLRLDLGATGTDAFEIDWIGVGTVGPASYGATWGQNVTGSAAVDSAIATAQSTATGAASAASAAQASATAAQSTLTTMRSNGYIDAAEKPALIRLKAQLDADYTNAYAQAGALGITTERTALATAKTALDTYLATLSPSWSDTTTDTPITPATDTAKWGDYWSASNVLWAKIAAVAATLASWAGVTGTGKPSDFANVAGVGGYVNADPTLIRPEMWTHSNTSGAAAAWANNFGVGEGLWTAMDKSAGGRDDIFSESMPVSPLRSYRIEAWVYKWAGSAAAHYLFVEFKDAAGAVVTTSTGWTAVGAFNFWGLAGSAPAVDGSNTYTFTFGRFGVGSIPATAVTMRVGILGGYSGSGRWSLGSLRLREYTDQATLTSTTWLTAGPGMDLIGNAVIKSGGTAAWASAVYSKDSFTGGAYVSLVPGQTNLQFMFGLNADPTTDAGFASIDYAMHCKVDGTLDVYSAGTLTAVSIGSYAVGDVLAVAYDGFKFTFVRNGAVLYSITNTAFSSVALYADSSFYSVGARAAALTFGPLSKVSGIETVQIAANAATEVDKDTTAAGSWVIGAGATGLAFVSYPCWSKWVNNTGVSVEVDYSGYVEVMAGDASYASGLRTMVQAFIAASDPADFTSTDGDQVAGFPAGVLPEYVQVTRTGRITVANGQTVYAVIRVSGGRAATAKTLYHREMQTTLAALKR